MLTCSHICISIYIHIHVYMQMFVSLSPPLLLYIYIYIYICLYRSGTGGVPVGHGGARCLEPLKDSPSDLASFSNVHI